MKKLMVGLAVSAFLCAGIARASVDYTNQSGYRQKITITEIDESSEYGVNYYSWSQMLYPGETVIYDDYYLITFTLSGIETLVGPSVSFQAINGQWLCAESGGGREVVANRWGAGPWETFVFQDADGGDIESGDNGFLRSDHGQFLCAENGGGSVLNATRNAGGPWEQFRIWKLDGGGNITSGAITSGDKVAVTSISNYYWCAEGGGGQQVNSNRFAIGPWETFTITVY